MVIKKDIIQKKRNWVIYIIAFCLPIVGLLVHMVIGKCYPFGDNSILIGDAGDQYLSFFTELYNRIKNGQSLLFSWNGGMGYDFYTTMMYYLMSPFNIIALCFGGYSMELGMIVTMAVEIGACAVSALYYFRHTYLNTMEHGKNNDGVTLAFSVAYAMCNYILAYQYNMMWLTSLVLVPVLMLGIEKIVRKNDYRLYVVTLFFVFIVNFYFAWFVCILSFFWFVDQNRGKMKERLNRFAKWFLVSIGVAVAASAVLIPCYELVRTRNDSGTFFTTYDWKSIGNFGNFIQGFFWGNEIDIQGSGMYTYNLYCGMIIFISMICYIFNKNIKLKYKIKRIFLIGVLVLSLNVTGLIYVMHGFSYPHLYANRQGFILVIFILISAFEHICKFKKIGKRYILLSGICMGLIIVISFVYTTNVQSLVCYMGTIMLCAYYFICLVLYDRSSITHHALIINIIVLCLIEILTNSFVFNDEDNTDIRMLPDIAASKWTTAYEELSKDKGERKTSWVFSRNNLIYSETNLFSSMKNTEMVWLFKKLGLTYQENGGSYSYRGTTPITAAMFNVRNVLTDTPIHYSGYTVEESKKIYNEYSKETADLKCMSNQYIAGLGFMASNEIQMWASSDENVFDMQNDFVEAVLEDENKVFLPADISDIEISGNYCLPLKQNGNKYPYISTVTDDAMMYLRLDFEIQSDMHLYSYQRDRNHVMAQVYIDGKKSSTLDSYPSCGETIDVGELKKGQKVTLVIYTLASVGTKGEMEVELYQCNDVLAKACVEKIREHKLEITKFEDTCVEGHITASEDGIMYTSIPYYKGFKVYVDGKQTEITKIGDALIGVKLQKGEHDIRITYFPYGLKLGIILSIFGIAGMIVICKKNKKYIIK